MSYTNIRENYNFALLLPQMEDAIKVLSWSFTRGISMQESNPFEVEGSGVFIVEWLGGSR